MAEWIAAVAAIVGTALSVVALVFANRANRTADEMRRDEADRSRLAREDAERRAQELDAQRMASALQAWWAARPADAESEKPRWGIVISNQGPEAAVFRSVRIDTWRYASRLQPPRAVEGTLTLPAVPPGTFFVESLQYASAEWDTPPGARPGRPGPRAPHRLPVPRDRPRVRRSARPAMDLVG